MKLINELKKIGIYLVLISVMIPASIHARTSSEIAEDIKKQQQLLFNTQKELEQAKKNLDDFNSSLANSQGGLPQIENEIKKLEAEIESNKYELDLVEQGKRLKELEKEHKEVKQNSTLKSMYMNWRIENTASAKEMLHAFDFKKYEMYASVLTNAQQDNIHSIVDDLNGLNKSIKEYEERIADLGKKNEELQQKKKDLEDQINYYNYQIYALGTQANNIYGNLSTLSSEHVAAIRRELELQNQTPVGPGSGSSGSLSFTTIGRDRDQGHGVGMSQYGALGAANSGWTFGSILQFYYTGTQVVDYPEMENITIVYCSNNPIYANPPGWPNPGCTSEQAVTKTISFLDYMGGIEEMPESWPIEARKAQIVAARTYAIRYTNNGAKPICITQNCQVSKLHPSPSEANWMHDGDLDVATATSGKVIMHNESLIEALYSSDNSQGYGTADNDTVWQSFEGYGSPYAYLRAVNDSDFAVKTYYTNKICQTNNYSFADIFDVIKFNKDTYWQTGYRSSIANLYNKLGGESGTISSITFIRDPSQRVKRVIFNNDSNISIGGSWFKALWNEWVVYKNKVNNFSCQEAQFGSPRYDFIYSLTFFLNVN